MGFNFPSNPSILWFYDIMKIICFPFCSLNEKQLSIPDAPLQMEKNVELLRCEAEVSGHY